MRKNTHAQTLVPQTANVAVVSYLLTFNATATDNAEAITKVETLMRGMSENGLLPDGALEMLSAHADREVYWL